MSAPLVLPAEVTIYVAAELRTAWLAWLDAEADGAGDAPEVLADGRAVAEVDAAGLQCLLALSRSLAARRQRLCLDRPTDVLRQACKRLGAAQLLGDTAEVGA